MHLPLTNMEKFSDTKSAILKICRLPLQMCQKACVDPESFVRGGPTLTTFFFFFFFFFGGGGGVG